MNQISLDMYQTAWYGGCGIVFGSVFEKTYKIP